MVWESKQKIDLLPISLPALDDQQLKQMVINIQSKVVLIFVFSLKRIKESSLLGNTYIRFGQGRQAHKALKRS